ncbi:MAG TPA: HAMP domain-containing sensor histidine kinase [Nannocystaceae bacterium]|nr:HAMP domain-containing sensor histidine kinase [Nannocystaceae bacterium]
MTPRSIRSRLALAFLLIALVSVGVVMLYVLPSLQERLQEQQLDSLSRAAVTYTRPLRRAIGSNVDEKGIDREVRTAADQANARVSLLGVTRGTEGIGTYLISDSTEEIDVSDLSFDVALEAVRTGKLATGTEASDNGRLGQAAQPLRYNRKIARVVVFSSPLNDVTDTVALIRQRILVAGAAAVIAAVLVGLLISRALARRIRRLERAAHRVAEGDFTARFPIDSRDELGQLARALDDMQSQLAQLDSARKRFIATASHELRTPIFSLSGFVELLLDEDLDDETRRAFLGQVRDQVARLRTLTTELLDLSRLEAGSLELRPETTDVAMLARAMTSEFLPALSSRGSHLELRLPARELTATCDPERVAQVLRILIDNALVHTPAGTDIVVAASRTNGSVALAVRDSGPGIRHADVERIFEPFFTSDDAQGSGLGLAIAHELAERMHGRLTVESHPGRTTFSFELPA